MSFHQFNSFTGRLKQTTQNQALYPLTPNKLQTTDVPTMIYDSIKTKPAKVMSGQRHQSTLTPKMERLYKVYQADLSKPTYLIGGMKKRLFYRISIVLTTVSLCANVYHMYLLNKKF